MAGLLVPLVLIPRYTTFAGADTYTTIGMDVTDYEKGLINFWRSTGVALAVAPTLTIVFEESIDQVTWSTCAGGPFIDPGASTETPFAPTFTKRWFRIRVVLPTANSSVSLWAIGFLQQRES